MSINRVRRIVNVGEAPTERDIPPNDPHYIDYRANKEHALSYIHRQKRPKTLLDILFPTPALSGTKRFILQTRSSVAPSRRVPNDFKGKFNIPRISEEKKQEAEEKLKRVSAKFVRRSGVNVDEAENNQSGSGLITGMGAQQGGRNY